jgi:hypothetical protein
VQKLAARIFRRVSFDRKKSFMSAASPRARCIVCVAAFVSKFLSPPVIC